MNNKPENIWKKSVVAKLRHYPGIDLEEVRTTAKTLVTKVGVQA
jgi:hypothetical protein